MLETVIQGGLVVFAQELRQADLGIDEHGRIGAIAEPGTLAGKHVVAADGLVVLPGAIDPHVHLNTQFGAARTTDDFYTGTLPAAIGGTTALVEFAIPQPGETTLAALARRYQEAQSEAVIDYNFHACVTGESFAASLPELP